MTEHGQNLQDAAAIRREIELVVAQLQVARIVHGTVTALITYTDGGVQPQFMFAQPAAPGSTPEEIPVYYPDWYSPTVGDTVICAGVGADLFMLTKMAQDLSIESAQVLTAESTSVAPFTDLATVGPTISMQTGNQALVTMSAFISSDTANCGGIMGFAVSGASTYAAGYNNQELRLGGVNPAAAPSVLQASATYLMKGLTPGLNTFTAKYQVATGGSATFENRFLIVEPK